MAKKNWNPKYKINTLKVFNRAYADSPRELRDKLRPFLSRSSVKKFYANLVRDKIIERTLEGLDYKGKKHTGYTEGYKNSIKFKIYKRQSTVRDLRLTGSMLNDIKSVDARFIITFNFGKQLNRGKAEGHISGRLGKRGVTRPREFFRLPKELENSLLKEAIKREAGADPVIFANLFDTVAAASIGVKPTTPGKTGFSPGTTIDPFGFGVGAGLLDEEDDDAGL